MNSYSDYLAKIFPGTKVQKISVDAGFSCPNRDGTIGTGGCIYCRNDSFTPSYCNSKESISQQLEKGINFFSRKYPQMKYLAYFQSYTGTYNKSIEELASMYHEAIGYRQVVGLVIATRPDCISQEVVNLLKNINSYKPVFVELGAETSHNSTLCLINRNHTWEDVETASGRIADAGLHCGIHLIAGLPGENREMILHTIKKTCTLPIETIKLHQLQILKDTPLLKLWQENQIIIPDFSLEEYLDLCREIINLVPEKIIIERFLSQSPPGMVVSPKWGLKNYEFTNLLEKLI